MTYKIKIAPSILASDFARLGEEVQAIEKAGADFVHVDVMDGHFVPNLTIGPPVIQAIRPHTKLPLDVHLMIEPVEPHIEAYANAGADIITVHAEATPHIDRAVQQIKALGKKAGVSLCPSTHESALKYVMDNVDLILVMSVNPGFGGQHFLTSQLPKITNLRKMITATKRDIMLQVDGGVNLKTAADCIKAGADVLVAGSAVFKGDTSHYQSNIDGLRNAA